MADEQNDDNLLSQDDINAALEAAGMGSHSVPDTPEPAGGDEGELTQADIDAALAGGSGELSQADIDAALAGAGGAAADASPSDSGQEATDEGEQRLDSAGRPFDEIAAAMAEAIEAEKGSGGDSSGSASPGGPRAEDAKPMSIPELDADGGHGGDLQSIDLLRDVNLDVKIELGRSRMYVEDVLRLNEGSVVELDKLAGDPVDVLVNGRLVARGEVLVLNDTFCVRINDIVSKLPGEEPVAV